MKTLYIQILTVVLFIATSISSFGQINREILKFEKAEYLILEKNQKISKGINPPCDCPGGGDVPSFTFNNHGISNAFYLSSLLQRARDRRLDEWFNKQNGILEKEIEKQLGKDFPNFTEAQKGLYKSREKTNVRGSVGKVAYDYRNKIKVKTAVRNRCLRNLKLLDFRANEINSGIINNSKYGHLKFNSTPLSQITSISQINNFKATEIKDFTNNQWRLDQEVKAKGLLEEINSSAFTDNHDLLNELYNKQLFHYNNQGDGWNKLNLMQLYVNDVNVSILVVKDIRIQYYGFSDYIEDYAIRKSPAKESIFHSLYWWPIKQNLLRNGVSLSNADAQVFALQRKAINKKIEEALNALSIDDLLKETAIAGLGIRNENFIKNKPDLKREIDAYFKVNDFSKVSSDCVNYLLNQYHNGGDFAANTNLYKSANTPLYQNAQNTNRALEWKPGTQAVAEGFTNFGNVLSSLFENYPNPAYEGRIIRDMFEVNKIKVPFEITNEVLGERFRFTITTNDYINIGFEGGVFNDIPPSCKSFNFKKIAGFHEAAVVNIKFEIFVLEIIGGVRFKKLIPIIFPQPVRFGVPIKFKNGSVISKGLAAELSARAIERSIKDLTSRYRNLSGTPSQIRSYFQERLKHNHREITNGGRVNFNDMSSILLTPTQYKASIWLRDDCD